MRKKATTVVMKRPAQISNGTEILSLETSGAWQHPAMGREVRSAGILLVVECDKNWTISLLAVTFYEHRQPSQ